VLTREYMAENLRSLNRPWRRSVEEESVSERMNESNNGHSFDYHALPPEIQRLLSEVVSNLRGAEEQIGDRNYGLALELLRETKGLLPYDNGVYTIWPESEERMRGEG
jgi:hypothetical protein